MGFSLPKLQISNVSGDNFNATVALTVLGILCLVILGVHLILDAAHKTPHETATKHLRAITIPHIISLIGLMVLCIGDAYELSAGMDWAATVVHFLGWVIWQASLMRYLMAITRVMRTESTICKIVYTATPWIFGLVLFQVTALGYWTMDSPNAPDVLFYTNCVTCTLVILDTALFLGIYGRALMYRLRYSLGQERTLARFGIVGCTLGILALITGCLTSFSNVQTVVAVISCRVLLLIMAITMTGMKWCYNRCVFIQRNGAVAFSRGYAMDQKSEIDAMEAAVVKPSAGVGAVA
jgi:hypothetical protein